MVHLMDKPCNGAPNSTTYRLCRSHSKNLVAISFLILFAGQCHEFSVFLLRAYCIAILALKAPVQNPPNRGERSCYCRKNSHSQVGIFLRTYNFLPIKNVMSPFFKGRHYKFFTAAVDSFHKGKVEIINSPSPC